MQVDRGTPQPTLKNLDEVLSEITPGEIQSQNSMRKGISFVDGHGMGHTISAIEDNTRRATTGIEGQDSLRNAVCCAFSH